MALLAVKDLKTYFYTDAGIVRAVNGVNFEIRRGEVVGLVGETGCGKSVTALSIIGLVQSPGKIVGGQIVFKGEDLLKKNYKSGPKSWALTRRFFIWVPATM